MEKRYKIILSNRNFYKEIEFPVDLNQVKVGTGIDCDFRLRKDMFFESVELIFSKDKSGWSVICSDNLYLTVGDIRKLITKQVSHGDIFEVKYHSSDNLVVNVEFMIDFDYGEKKYNRAIDVSDILSFTIGELSSNNICLSSQYIKTGTTKEHIKLIKKGTSLELLIESSYYGVYHNGNKAKHHDLIKDGDFFSLSDYFFYFKDGRVWTESRDDMAINDLSYEDYFVHESYPKFNRNTRIKTILSDDKIEILDPPAKPQKPKNNLFMKLLPSLGMLLASGVMAFMGGTMIIFSAISGVMAIVTTLVGVKEGKKEFEESSKSRIEKYNAYIEKKKQDIEKLRKEEKASLEDMYVSQDVEKERFNNFSSDLFDRSPSDDDFLTIRLGKGQVEAKQEIDYKKQEKLEVEDDLQLIPEQIYADYKFIKNAPITCDLKEINAIGVVGEEVYRFEVLKNMVVDIAARQYHTDVKMAFIANEENKDKIHWLRMLPHVYAEEIGNRLLVCEDESKNVVFEYLYKELSLREQNKTFKERILVFFYDEYGFKNHPISKFIEKAKDLGVTFIFFGNSKADIPMGCSYIIETKDANKAILINAEDKSNSSNFVYPNITDEQAKNIVKILAPVYTEEISLEGTLTKNISMFEMLNILAVDDLDLAKRWASSQVTKSMAAPLGVSKTGTVSLDLHDKAHGPHGLVAGTTGSGKSEILQTYILAMSTLYHPYEVGFVIIDFKGGGMVNQFKQLPHLLGAITDIDGKEINRSLKSIKAELEKRKRLFADADVNHIDKYIRKYKANEVNVPLPHLIIIVDEFAELKAEQPEFMKELISAARIGRSLGVHLILATQKPSGQVNEQIWSNSRFKLCLKVQSQEDSNEVIKSPLAAEIKEPGRAYLQVGNNEIFELFQSAYSGASEKTDDSNIKEFTIYNLTDAGKRVPIYSQKKNKGEGGITQLDSIVRYVSDYCKQIKLPKLSDICLPSLEKSISISQCIPVVDNKYSIGIYDDPDTQYQGDAYFDFDSNNTIIIGSSQTGKTNLLQLIVREIATHKKANEANFYILDFGSMILKNFEKLNHVGGVVLPSEDEKLKNLFKLLSQELEVRKARLMSVGVSSINSYNEAGFNDIPHIYILLENFAVFRELYADKYEDDLLFIAREGITYGISLIVTTTTTSGFGYKYMSNFANHIAFSCNDSSEYSNLFDRCRIEPSNVPGRTLICLNKVIYEAQTYISFDGEKEIDRINSIRDFVEMQNKSNIGLRAKAIPVIPNILTQDYIYNNFTVDLSTKIAVALNYQTVEPVYFDITSMPQLAIVGKQTANLVAFEKSLISEIKNSYFERPTNVYIIDSLSRDLINYSKDPFVEEYSIDYSNIGTIFEKITQELEERYSEVIKVGTDALNNKPLLFVLINNISAIDFISSSKTLMALYTSIITKYKAMKVMLVFGNISDETIGYSSGDVLKKLKENKNAVIFSNLADHKVFDIPAAYIRQNKKAIDNTQGYYLKGNDIVKIRFTKEECK